MTTGVTTFNSADQTVSRMTFEPLNTGDYELSLIGSQLEIRRSDSTKGSSGLENVNVRFRALNTGKDGGKARVVFHSFHLSLEPGKDGVVMPNRGGQLIEFARACGVELTNIPVNMDTDSRTNKQVKVLDSQAVKSWLEQLDGVVIRARVRKVIEPGRNPQNKIDYFDKATDTDEYE